jgi:riboflavin synthase
MFTGIVQSQAKVLLAKIENNLLKLQVSVSNQYTSALQLGASIANNGVCLTVVDYSAHTEHEDVISFDVIDETLRVTNLSKINVGDYLNLERSLKVGDEIGGHMVSGHIHCQAIVTNIIKTSTNCTLVFGCDKPWLKYILSKGFITINGTSLTVGEVNENGFTVHLIPETLTRTNLGQAIIGSAMNIELDQQTITIVDTIERLQLSLKK